MSLIGEFKEFINRGSVVDLAVGVVIGAAFGKIVTALVNGIVMPPVGLMIAGVKFADLKWVLKPAGLDPEAEPEVAIAWGAFVNTLIEFLIIAFVIFLVVKAINSLRRKEAETPAAPTAPTTTDALLMEIRDALARPVAPAPARAAPTAPAKKAPVRKPVSKK